MKDISNEEDIRESKHATRSQGRILRIEQGRTPVYLLDSKYEDGFAHWVQLPSGDNVRIPCGGGTEGGGYAPDICPICNICKEQYRQARAMEQSRRKESGAKLRNATNRIRGKYEMYFLAAKGELNVLSLEGGKKRYTVDFEDAQVGLLSLTKKQRDDLLSVPGKLAYMGGKDGLLNRYIILDKRVRGEDDYNTIEFQPAKKPTPMPEVEWDGDEINLEGLFDVDTEELERTAGIVLGDEVEDSEVDFEDGEEDEGAEHSEEDVDEKAAEPLEEEVGEESEEEVEEAPLEIEEDSVEEYVEDADTSSSTTFDDSFLEDVDDDDFEDDLPWEQDEEKEEEKPKAKKKTTATPKKKKSATKAQTTTKRKETTVNTTAKKKTATRTTKAAPKKSTTVKAKAGAATGAKRRGRPPGSTNKPKTMATATEPKRRGRPPGSTNKSKSTTTTTAGAKRRGRPPTKNATSRKNTANRKKSVPETTDF